MCVALECGDGTVLLGCDSFLGGAQHHALVDRPKYRRVGPVWLAVAGQLRWLQVAAQPRRWPARRPGEEATDYLVRGIADPLRRAFEGARNYENDPEFEMLLAYQGRAYYLDWTFAVHRFGHGYGACGTGEREALASLASTEGMRPEARMDRALAAAARHCNTVSPPFHTERVR